MADPFESENSSISASQPGMINLGTNTEGQPRYLSDLFNPANTDLAGFFSLIFSASIAIGAMLAVLRLGYAGIIYMTTDMWHPKQSAKEMISQAVLGILLLLAVYLILFQINPDILNLDILRSTK